MNDNSIMGLIGLYLFITCVLWYIQFEEAIDKRLTAIGCIFWPVIVVMAIIGVAAGSIICFIYYTLMVPITLFLAIIYPQKLEKMKL